MAIAEFQLVNLCCFRFNTEIAHTIFLIPYRVTKEAGSRERFAGGRIFKFSSNRGFQSK
ncbi:hypothetical protein COO91_03738 [Nostoc flagelliforme CCNUN1]|uniref:Uncharacterized protein n=1 Tax=Nostoc flagelliforme CCNUN1 TaxID=2038116 RepID=A0A2K8SQP6_9NOSO|nr:hypothetical protein COO91_03738 [Nostoc flagelliforme CCNUN1]